MSHNNERTSRKKTMFLLPEQDGQNRFQGRVSLAPVHELPGKDLSSQTAWHLRPPSENTGSIDQKSQSDGFSAFCRQITRIIKNI